MEYKNFEIEHKRRFLVSTLPASIMLENMPFTEIQLGYLSKELDTLEIECECVSDKFYTMNIRDAGFRKRNKIKIPLDEEAASVIMSLSRPKIITIKSYTFDIDGRRLTLNSYDNISPRLLIVEYSGNEIDVRDYKPLNWFSTEVTDMYHYTNLSIAINKKY